MIFLFFGTSLALLEAELQHFKEIGDGLVARERQRLPKNLILGQKHNFFKNPKKLLGPKQKYFQTLTDKISSEQLTKLQKIKPFGHSKAPKKKNYDRYCSFSPSWAELPICVQCITLNVICMWYGVVICSVLYCVYLCIPVLCIPDT